MIFPNEKIIFEIPIYSMPENEFETKWMKWKNKWHDMMKQVGMLEVD